jgi:hypothetical protein
MVSYCLGVIGYDNFLIIYGPDEHSGNWNLSKAFFKGVKGKHKMPKGYYKGRSSPIQPLLPGILCEW